MFAGHMIVIALLLVVKCCVIEPTAGAMNTIAFSFCDDEVLSYPTLKVFSSSYCLMNLFSAEPAISGRLFHFSISVESSVGIESNCMLSAIMFLIMSSCRWLFCVIVSRESTRWASMSTSSRTDTSAYPGSMCLIGVTKIMIESNVKDMRENSPRANVKVSLEVLIRKTSSSVDSLRRIKLYLNLDFFFFVI